MDIPGLLSFSEDLLKVCDQEPIHIPGSIQPHGVLLAFATKSGHLVYASENSPDFFGVSSSLLLSWTFDDFACSADKIDYLLPSIVDQLSKGPSQRMPIQLPGRMRFFDIEAHLLGDDCLVLEISQKLDCDPSLNSHSEEIHYVLRMKKTLQSIETSRSFLEAMEIVACQVREITCYDRVMIYRFDSLGHGEVIVDDHREDLESFLGLHYPASDIPKQARALFLVNRVRQLVDVRAVPSQVIPIDRFDSSQKTLDMSLCYLRSVSPVHLQYLENMGVRATLVISVIIDNKLWGLISCHHMTPKQLTSEMRLQCDLLSYVLSAAIQSEERRQYQRAAVESNACFQQLESAVESRLNWKEYLLTKTNLLLDLLHACGVVWVTEETKISLGNVPATSILDSILLQLTALNLHETQSIQSLDELPLNAVRQDGDIVGYVAVAVSKNPSSYLVWFREAQSQSIDWGGDPRKSLEQVGDSFQLSPRKSFAKWRQEIDNFCLPWSEQDHLRAKSAGLFFAVKQLDTMNRTKSEFLANMSHEIRTPMTAILGFTDLLESDFLKDASQTANAIETIRSNAKHLLTIINDILDMSKIEAGKMTVEKIEVSPAMVVREVVSLMQPRAIGKGIDLRLDYETPLPTSVKTDPTRLRQILINLIGNAIKFTEVGGVTISTSFQKESGQIRFGVVDTGIGMTPDQLDVVARFDAFSQADGTTTRQFGGTGLGLRISNALAVMLGGGITIESTVGVGSIFTLTVSAGDLNGVEFIGIEDLLVQPTLQKAATISKSVSTDIATLNLTGLRILLAEDGPDNQRLISFHLKKLGANVTIADNGQMAIEQVEIATAPFDVIFMDMQMPVLDGYEATKRLRKIGYDGPIVALTAHAMESDRQKCIDAGCDDYTTKPIVRQTLIELAQHYGERMH